MGSIFSRWQRTIFRNWMRGYKSGSPGTPQNKLIGDVSLWKGRTLFLSGHIYLWRRAGNCRHFSGFRRRHKRGKWGRRPALRPRITWLCSLWPGRRRGTNPRPHSPFKNPYRRKRARYTCWRIYAFNPYGSSKPLYQPHRNSSRMAERCCSGTKRKFFPNSSRSIKKRTALKLNVNFNQFNKIALPQKKSRFFSALSSFIFNRKCSPHPSR